MPLSPPGTAGGEMDKRGVYMRHPLHGDALPEQPATPLDEEKPFDQLVEHEKQILSENTSGGTAQDGKPKKTKRKAIVRETLAINDSNLFASVDLQVAPTILDNIYFQLVVFIAALLNVLVMGFEADFGCMGTNQFGWSCPIGDRLVWYLLDNIFTVLFVADMVLRLFARGPAHYFTGDGIHGLEIQWMNCIDLVIVVLRAVDTWILMPLNVDVKIKILSCFRIMHIAPLVKRFRLNSQFREPWIILSLLSDTYKIIFWVVIVMFLFIWIVAIVVTYFFGKGEDDAYVFDYSEWSWKDYWGTIPRSMFSLFQVVTLDKWAHSLVRPLFKRNALVMLFFAPFICFTTLGLVNVIVAVVVESTIASAAANEEKLNKKMQKVHRQVMESLQEIFEAADVDKSGDLDTEELHSMVQDPNVRDRLALLDISIQDLNTLFDLLDEQQLGSISCTRFFRGCARLRGNAMACDLHRMSIDLSRYIQWTADLVGHNRNTNKRLSTLLYDIAGVDRDILKGEEDDHDPVLLARRDRAVRGSDFETFSDVAEEKPPSRQVSMPKSDKGRATPRHSEVSYAFDDIRIIHGQIRKDIQQGSDDEGYVFKPDPPPMPSHLMRRNKTGSEDSFRS